MSTVAQDPQVAGAALIPFSLFLMMVDAIDGGLGGGDMLAFTMIAVIGVAFFLGSRLTVPTWARTREEQMEAIIARTTAMLARTDETKRLDDGRE